MTAWHVLTHTSGVPDTSIERLIRERPTYKRMLHTVLTSTPDFPPGSRFRYASASWMLLARVMAELSGMPFSDALQDRITDPLGMTDTRFDPRYARSRVATVHGLRIRNRLVGEIAHALHGPGDAAGRRALRDRRGPARLRARAPRDGRRHGRGTATDVTGATRGDDA